MNKKSLWIGTICAVFLFIIAVIFGVYTFKNGFNLQDGKASNLFSFLGGMLGTFFSVAGSFIILWITIRKNNEQQIKLINEQNSIQVENNLQQKYNREREIFSSAYNSIEQFLITSKTYVVNESPLTFINVIDRLNSVYADYRKCINSVLITTNVYTLQDKCIGCTLCDIKSYGELARVLKNIQIIINQIQKTIQEINLKHNIIFGIALKNKQLTDNKSLQTNLLNNYINEQKVCSQKNKSFRELQNNINNVKELIINFDIDINKNITTIINENSSIQILLNTLDTLKLDFFNFIREYFEIVKYHISEQVKFVKNKGRTSVSICKKYNLENLETKKSKSNKQ